MTTLPEIDRTTAGFGLAAAITIVFNTVFAWVKDASDPLTAAMAKAMGHHWTTHGVVDVLVFVALGLLLSRGSFARSLTGAGLARLLVIATIIGGAGLAGWFLFV